MQQMVELSDQSMSALLDFLAEYASCLPDVRQRKIANALEVLTDLLSEFEQSRGDC